MVLLLHGLGGCARSGYMLGLIAMLSARGYQCVAMQYRGAGPANRLDRFFYAGDYHDPATVAGHIAAHAPGRPLYAVGFSLGANMLLTWLAVAGARGPVSRAVAVSPPFDLGACADAINRGFARVYQRDLLNNLKRMYAAKFRDRPGPLPTRTVAGLHTLRAFDDRITAPSHGFSDAADYYARCSCGPRITRVATPALVLHARDDPFVPAGDIPAPADLPAPVTLEVTARGGHVGFVAGRGPLRLWPAYWAETRIADFLDAAPATG